MSENYHKMRVLQTITYKKKKERKKKERKKKGKHTRIVWTLLENPTIDTISCTIDFFVPVLDMLGTKSLISFANYSNSEIHTFFFSVVAIP